MLLRSSSRLATRIGGGGGSAALRRACSSAPKAPIPPAAAAPKAAPSQAQPAAPIPVRGRGSGPAAAAANRARQMGQHPRLGRMDVPQSRISKIPARSMIAATALAVTSCVLSTIIYFETVVQMEGLGEEDEEYEEEEEDLPLFEVEPFTSCEFPTIVRARAAGSDRGGQPLWLVRSSVRCMLGWCWLAKARVYAFGLYVSRDGGRACAGAADVGEVLERLGLGAPPAAADGSGSASLFQASAAFAGPRPGFVFKLGDSGVGYYHDVAASSKEAAAAPCEVLLRIVLARDAGGDHLAKGFDKTLMRRVRLVVGGEGEGGDAGVDVAETQRFIRMLRDQATWTSGTTIDFLRRRDGALVVTADGAERGVYPAPIMAWALFDAFVGPKGHFPASCKEAIADKLGGGRFPPL